MPLALALVCFRLNVSKNKPKQLTSAGLRPSREKLAGDGGREDPTNTHTHTQKKPMI